MEEVLETATKEGADSDYYEAHAVLLNIKRKQMDSAGGMLEIARATKDAELRTPRPPSPRPRRRAARSSRTSSPATRPGSRRPRPDGDRGAIRQAGIDPGAYIGHEPEREAESIPGGVSPRDERTSAYDSRSGVSGEPDDPLELDVEDPVGEDPSA